MRTLITPYGAWRYMVGKCYVRFVAPSGKACAVSISDVTGRPSETIERGRWKRTQDGMVTPVDVRRYLDRVYGGRGRAA